MAEQMVAVGELLLTHRALEWLVTRVDPFMSLHGFLPLELLVTARVRTRELLLAGIVSFLEQLFPVNPVVVEEREVTHLAELHVSVKCWKVKSSTSSGQTEYST